MSLSVLPVNASTFGDLATLFGPRGANSGCWCMWWRVPASSWQAAGNAGNRAALAKVIDEGQPVGLLGYRDGVPVGWAAVAPRTAYPRLLRSPTLRLAPPDEAGVWSVTCFFIDRRHRRTGVATALLEAAVDYAAHGGARVLEGYPKAATGRTVPSGELFTGTVELFSRAGFRQYDRPITGTRVVMRRRLGRRP